MKTIAELQAIVDTLEGWTNIMAILATCPRPYNRADKYMIVMADKKVDRAFKLLKKEVGEGAKMAIDFQQLALRLRDPDKNQDAIASCILLNGIIHQTNFYLDRFNTFLALCESHV